MTSTTEISAKDKGLAHTHRVASVSRRAWTKTNVRISLDIGYYTCVAYDDQQMSTLCSVYAKLPTGQKSPVTPNTFTLQSGDDCYLASEGALTQRNYLPFANGNKLSAHILKMALYALGGDGEVDLVISHYRETGASWVEYFDEYRDNWFKGVIDAIKTDCAYLLPRLKRFVVTGGGAYLIAEKPSNGSAFVVLDKPGMTNAVGAYYTE